MSVVVGGDVPGAGDGHGEAPEGDWDGNLDAAVGGEGDVVEVGVGGFAQGGVHTEVLAGDDPHEHAVGDVGGREFGRGEVHAVGVGFLLICGQSGRRSARGQRGRLVEIRDNLLARITEAEREGWLGELEGLEASLTGAQDKLAQLDAEDARRSTAVDLGIPTFRDIAGRHSTFSAASPSRTPPSSATTPT
ncbi:hypothetical protein ABZY09_43515 [Streptomyces sp. NPDC002928]|uniref:hypothetical protein n=1 Tax=Streptomyces sp. NPDC002928 TaxID=3154440 RepID=UPI0033B5D155